MAIVNLLISLEVADKCVSVMYCVFRVATVTNLQPGCYYIYYIYAFHRRNALIKTLIKPKLFRKPKNLGLYLFLDSVGHFAAPWL